MYKEVMIARADGKDEPTPMLANAATPLRYKQIFGDDLLTLFANAEQMDESGRKSYHIDFVAELAFIMAMQAKAHSDDKIKLEKLSANSLIDWLEDFDSMAIENAIEDIIEVYMGNTKTGSEAKKNKDEQSES